MTGDLVIRLLDGSTMPGLNKFLQQQPRSTVYHQCAWHEVIRQTYGHRCRYWVALRGDNIVGCFPVVLVHYPLLGTKAIAMSHHFEDGAPLTDDESIAHALVQHAVDDARTHGAKFLEIRHTGDLPYLSELGFEQHDSRMLTINASLEDFDIYKIRRGHRDNVRRAERNGVIVRQSKELDDLKLFRDMYLREGRFLGAPQPGWKFYENFHRLMHDQFKLFMAWYDNQCIGAIVNLDDGCSVMGRWSAYNSNQSRKLHAGKALIWHAMDDAAKRGCKRYNFGITSSLNKGLVRYKEGWNGTTQPIYISICPLKGKAKVPDYLGGYSTIRHVWRRLPLPVVDLAGAQITRWFC